ncbi:MAG: hypothetical protein HGGPFJEG_03047 [Ignavibacteria bacterium]|nr:hypothetical protein [Ignavibacteria bacterium]
MNKIMNKNYGDRLLIGALILSAVPFLLLCLFVNPSPEDFYYANASNHNNLWKDVKIQYENESGRYFQYVLLYFIPMFDNDFIAYKAACFVLILIFFYSLYTSIKLIFQNELSLKENLMISLSVYFLYLYAMPIVSAGFYWYGGITAYHIPVILIPLFFAMFVRINRQNKISSKAVFFFLSCLMIICIEGSNEILAVLFFLFTIILSIYSIIIKKKINGLYILFTAIAGVCLFILIKARGNTIRITHFPNNKDFIFSFTHTITYLADNILHWIFTTPLLALTLIMLPLFSEILNRNKNRPVYFPVNPLMILTYWLGILFISTFMVYWSTGVVLERTSNLIYLFFLTGWFISAFAVFRYFQKNRKVNLNFRLKYLYILTFTVLLFFLFKQNNIKTAYTDLIGGSAYNYNLQMNERFRQIRECNSDNCLVDSIKNIPKTIFYKDITSDTSMLNSEWYGTYFNKKIIALKKSDTKLK